MVSIIPIPLYIYYYDVSLGWPLYTGSTIYVQHVSIVVLCIVCMLTNLHTCTCIHTHNLHTLHYVYICSVLTQLASYISPNYFSYFSSLKDSQHVSPSNSLLLNRNILHLILSLMGTLDSEHECIEIPYPQAFEDLLAGETKPWDSVKQAGEFYQIPPYQNYNFVPILT